MNKNFEKISSILYSITVVSNRRYNRAAKYNPKYSLRPMGRLSSEQEAAKTLRPFSDDILSPFFSVLKRASPRRLAPARL